MCIIDSIGKQKNKTENTICFNLFGKACVYPDAGCQFAKKKKNICNITLDAVTKTLEYLAGKGILKRSNAVEPYKWKIVL